MLGPSAVRVRLQPEVLVLIERDDGPKNLPEIRDHITRKFVVTSSAHILPDFLYVLVRMPPYRMEQQLNRRATLRKPTCKAFSEIPTSARVRKIAVLAENPAVIA